MTRIAVNTKGTSLFIFTRATRSSFDTYRRQAKQQIVKSESAKLFHFITKLPGKSYHLNRLNRMSNISKVAKNFALAVRDMRQHQKDFFKARGGSPEKASALKHSVAAEKKVDDMLKVVSQTIEGLESQEKKEDA